MENLILFLNKINKNKKMFCEKCGEENTNNSNFCKKCGNELIILSNEKKEVQVEASKPVTNQEISTSEDTGEVQPVSRGTRFVNYLLDLLLYIIFSFILGFILGISGLYELMNLDAWNDTVLGLLLISVYYILSESIFSKSPAKYFTKTKVVMVDSREKPNLGSIFIRTLSRFIPLEPLSFLFSKNPHGWHDKLSKTIVISE